MGDFNRVDDRPEDRTRPTEPDRFERFKAETSAWVQYREAYYQAQQSGVPLVDLPHPENITAAEAAEAMERLRGMTAGVAKLRTVPPIDVQG